MTDQQFDSETAFTRGLKVTTQYHRVTIPKDARDEHGIGEGDEIMVKVDDRDYREVTFFPTIDDQGRFTVPGDVCEWLGIESGDRVGFRVIA